ncbi:hypothetical protein AGMMS50256_33710 [Betaproteobacteria bacterium]|nr:hypothetical protein AGMMS50256_33710 [Betaproteobacteria bacterium]
MEQDFVKIKEYYARLSQLLFFDIQRLGEDWLRKRLTAHWPMLPAAAEPKQCDFMQIIRFALAVDSEELHDRKYPLRAEYRTIAGKAFLSDANVFSILAKELLLLIFKTSNELFDALDSSFRTRHKDLNGLERYLLAFLTGSVALNIELYSQASEYFKKTRAIYTDCVYSALAEEAIIEASGGTLLNYDLSERTCLLPFNQLMSIPTNIESFSYAFGLCNCPSMLPFYPPPENPWNGTTAQEIRRSIHDGSFRYCNKLSCFHIKNGTLPKKTDISDAYISPILDNKITKMPRGPYTLVLGHDATCNLACPQCRTGFCHTNKIEQGRHFSFFKNHIEPLMTENLHWIWLGNTGEAFASPHTLQIIKSMDFAKFPHLKFMVLSNGQLLTPSLWKKLGEAARRMTHFRISVDGAEKSYERLRYPGKWEKLETNMAFLSSKRDVGEILNLVVQCVVQTDNLPDLWRIYEKSLEWHVDACVFTPLRNVGTMTETEFIHRSVFSPEHPLHEEMQTIFSAIRKDAEGKPVSIFIG